MQREAQAMCEPTVARAWAMVTTACMRRTTADGVAGWLGATAAARLSVCSSLTLLETCLEHDCCVSVSVSE